MVFRSFKEDQWLTGYIPGFFVETFFITRADANQQINHALQQILKDNPNGFGFPALEPGSQLKVILDVNITAFMDLSQTPL